MPTYITLANYTQKGIENIKNSPARLEKVKEAIKAAGGEFKAFYLTMGRYDVVVISEAPNDEAYAATILAIGSAVRKRLKPSPKRNTGKSSPPYREKIGDLLSKSK